MRRMYRAVVALLVASPLSSATAQGPKRISIGLGGENANGSSFSTVCSADGRFVAFLSEASNLVVGDYPFGRDIFLYDRESATTSLVSRGLDGGPADDGSDFTTISADGRYVAFSSFATNLVADDTNDAWDVFVWDRITGATTRASVDSAGVQGDGDSTRWMALSATGRTVAFTSDARNLVPNDTNNLQDIFVHDFDTGVTSRVSVNSVASRPSRITASADSATDRRFRTTVGTSPS